MVVVPKLPVAVLLGQDVGEPKRQKGPEKSLAVVTRSQKQQGEPASSVGESGDKELRGKESDQEPTVDELTEEEEQTEQDPELRASPQELREWQQKDKSLKNVTSRARESGDMADERVGFFYKQGLLYRKWRPDQPNGQVKECQQLVLPKKCRKIVLRLAHAVSMAGHLGVAKTKDRILQRYYWPGIFKDTAEYCRSCEVCQKSNPRQPARAEMVPMPLMTQPFRRIAMDIVGPLPRTQRGNRFILTICDYATRYPEAVALPSVEAHQIAKELVTVFARVGVPEEILSDQGTNFMSTLMEDVYRLLKVSPTDRRTGGTVQRYPQVNAEEVCEQEW